MPIVGNLLGTKTRLAMAFGVEGELESEYISRRQRPIKPLITEDSPSRKVIIQGKIDILEVLPVLTHRERDAEPYITTGITVVRDPETGVHRMGLHRIGVRGPDRVALAITSPGMSKIVQKAEAKGIALDLAIVLGTDPLTFLSSVAFVPEGVDKYEIAGALARRPLSLIQGLTTDLLIPAKSEIVMEGRLVPGIREEDGPFGDSDGFYTYQNCCLAQINTLYHRANPIYHALMTFTSEDALLIELAWGSELQSRLREKFPQVKRLKISNIGYSSILQVAKGSDEEVTEIIEYYWSLNPFSKLIVAVDDDIDPEELKEVEWAVTSRCHPERNVRIVTDPDRRTSYCAVDATVPVSERRAKERVKISEPLLAKAKSIIDPLLSPPANPLPG